MEGCAVQDLRAELQQLDAELAEATLFLQQQRHAFTDQVARQDRQHARTAEEVNTALQELEAERWRMDQTHRELESESAEAKRLEAMCAELETKLDLRPEGPEVSTDYGQEVAELQAAIAQAQGVEPDAQQTLSSGCFGCRYPAPQEEWLLERAEDELAAGVGERDSLRSTLEAAEARVPLQENPAKALAAEMRRALEEMAAESFRQAEALQAHAEQRLEDACHRTAAVATKVSRARARCAWDREVMALLDALKEAESITQQQLQLVGSSQAAAREVAALRHRVSRELHASFSQAFQQ
ncbi:hypothetical protein AK812_SmicGene12944 [Symbiodinium microadriaticum]|uniref:Uncharacterized protein n=1 Tax=Symbiodinium microadriaticum TaxID=2951 RepID=A0A1Q9E9D0_SYMMI|nr:hypothetical protein AK812_SmicGene12944 [Symbiodinium microadriaticum]